jgi:adenosylmethionine-8-amino-7-oxononanoate aminotransferase
VAAIIIEPVVGAALGAAAAPPRYLERVRKICDEHGILLILDEVMTGFARTGRPFAWQYQPAQPDIQIMGKAMSGGYFPLSGIATTERVAAPIKETSPYFDNGQTHLFNAAGAAVGAYILERIHGDRLPERAACNGARLLERLQVLREFEIVGDIRGVGLLLGIEFVRRKSSRQCFNPDLGVSQKFAQFARGAGLIVYPSSGGADTLAGDHVLLLPPLVIGDDEIEFAVDCLYSAVVELQRWVS